MEDLHEIYKEIQEQIEMSDYMLVVLLKALNKLTLNINKAEEQIDKILHEEPVVGKLVGLIYLFLSFFFTYFFVQKVHFDDLVLNFFLCVLE